MFLHNMRAAAFDRISQTIWGILFEHFPANIINGVPS